MNNKKPFLLGALSGVLLVLVLNFVAMPFLGNNFGVPLGGNGGGSAVTDDPAQAERLRKMEEIVGLLDAYYVEDFDHAPMYELMYEGLVYGVGDPYTAYMDKKMYEEYMIDTEGVYTGIGVVVVPDSATNRIMIVSPYEGYPAAKAGLLPGDAIIRVEETDVFGDTMDLAVSMMRGEPSTDVTITVYRDSESRSFEVTITRELINMPTVSHRMLEDNIGYLRITTFDRVTTQQYKDAFADLQKQEMAGMILDLRNNPGGLVNVVCEIADTLLPRGTIVSTVDKYGRSETVKSDAACINVPLLVLVNGNSASASEILAGAVKDLGVGELVGSRTFGKGLVQTLFELEDGSALKVTIQKYYTPSGVCIQGEGIPVHYEIDMSDELSVQISTLTAEEDVQLAKAVEVMKGKLAE